MSGLNISEVEADHVLVVPQHGSEPLVVSPAAHSGDGSDHADIESNEDNTSPAS